MSYNDYTKGDKEIFMSGVRNERERIIKLIESVPRVAHDGLINSGQLIALIKGETE